jgi:hypothetical protein
VRDIPKMLNFHLCPRHFIMGIPPTLRHYLQYLGTLLILKVGYFVLKVYNQKLDMSFSF